MGFFFRNFSDHKCCLCGRQAKLTGEHKIKASSLKKEFGKQGVVVFRTDESGTQGTIAQSTKSKHLKFKASLCEECNTSRTQAADREFDRFSQLVETVWSRKKDPLTVFEDIRYKEKSQAYLNIFRYFAKMLCCQMAAGEAPIPRRVALFALGRSDHNPIFLTVKENWNYKQIETVMGSCRYAGHGGLAIYGEAQSNSLHRFHSSVSVGSLQYVFWMHLEPVEQAEIKYLYPQFHRRCQAELAKTDTATAEANRLRLGFSGFPASNDSIYSEENS